MHLNDNNLTGPIPDSFLQLQRLRNFYADVYNCVPETALFRTWLRRIPDSGATSCSAADRAALVRLYEATDGPNWTSSYGWVTDAPLGDWYGVTTDGSGRVVGLDLSYDNNLKGPIPPELGNLSSLEELDLRWNELYGPIPASFLRLDRLTRFRAGVYNCVPTTAAFIEWLERIPDRGASLCTDLDRAVLKQLYEATDGRTWRNRQNWMTDAPLGQWYGVSVDNEGHVTQLSLEVNNLNGRIPIALAGLAHLKRLYLTGNNLSGSIPSEIGYLTRLEILSLRSNSFSGRVPPTLGRLTNLQELSLADNRLVGEIPGDLSLLCNLRQLYLDRNDFSRLPTSAQSCFGRDLEVLHLHDNPFLGPFPLWLESLKKLTYLTFGAQDESCLPANDEFRAWVGDLQERRALARAPHTPAWCGEGFWYTWRFEQTTTGRSWTGRRPFAAHRLRGEPMLLRIFMGMENNTHVRWSVPSPRILVTFYNNLLTTVDVPAGAIPLWETADRAHDRDPFYRESINILIPGHLVDRGDTEAITITFDPDRTFSKVVGNRMPALSNDLAFAPSDWVRRIEFRAHSEIMSEGHVPTRRGWFTQDMPTTRIYIVPLVKSETDDKGMIDAVRMLYRVGPGHVFFRETLNLLPIRDLVVDAGVGLVLGYHPTHDNRSKTLNALGRFMWFNDDIFDGYDYVVGLRPGRGGVARPGKRSSVVGFSEGYARNSLAHELGHNMNLKHAPCTPEGKEIDGIDEDYPWPDGSIGPRGIRGIDLGVTSLERGLVRRWGGDTIRSIDRPMLLDPNELDFIVDSNKPDLMSYCEGDKLPLTWISAYHFDKALNYRQPASDRAQITSAARVNALVLSGGRTADGELFLEPAFVGKGRPVLPQRGGRYRIVGQNEQGAELFSLDFTMDEIADGDGAGMFLFAVPVGEGWDSALVRITLTGPEGSATVDRDGATVAVLLRDSSGEVRGILHDWTNSAPTAGDIAAALGDPSIADLDIQVSRGIPDTSYWRR